MTYLKIEEQWGYQYQHRSNHIDVSLDGTYIEFSHRFDRNAGAYHNFNIDPTELGDLIEMLQEVKEKVEELGRSR